MYSNLYHKDIKDFFVCFCFVLVVVVGNLRQFLNVTDSCVCVYAYVYVMEDMVLILPAQSVNVAISLPNSAEALLQAFLVLVSDLLAVSVALVR